MICTRWCDVNAANLAYANVTLITSHVLVQREILSAKLAQLRPPTELARQPRPLEEAAFWKGTECRVSFKSGLAFFDAFVLGAYVFAVDTTYKSMLFA